MSKGQWDEARLGAAIGRFVLGGLVGGVLWLVLVLLEGTYGSFPEWAIFEWLARLRVLAGFVLGGALLGLFVGDRFFRNLVDWWDY